MKRSVFFVLPRKISARNSHLWARYGPKRERGSVRSRQNRFTQNLVLGKATTVCSNLLQIALKGSPWKGNILLFPIMASQMGYLCGISRFLQNEHEKSGKLFLTNFYISYVLTQRNFLARLTQGSRDSPCNFDSEMLDAKLVRFCSMAHF